jgi:hypothetical protein
LPSRTPGHGVSSIFDINVIGLHKNNQVFADARSGCSVAEINGPVAGVRLIIDGCQIPST